MFWKFGIWFSCNSTVRLTNFCDPCPINILIVEWVWKDWCQLLRKNAVIMTLTPLCLFSKPSKKESKKEDGDAMDMDESDDEEARKKRSRMTEMMTTKRMTKTKFRL